MLERQGIEVQRLDKPKATEDELIEAIHDAEGYILGGVETVTERIINSAPKLKAIVFTGAGYKEFIPCYELAKSRNISIANAPGGNSYAVSEYTIALILAMTRNIFDLGRTGKCGFMTTPSIIDKSVGIIGMGNIGLLVAKHLKALGVEDVTYFSKKRKHHIESGFGISYTPIEEIARRSDIITLHSSKDAGYAYFDRELVDLMKTNSLLINTSYPDAVDENALLERLSRNEISAAFDAPPKRQDFNDLPLSRWYSSNSQTAFNTDGAIETVSAMAVTSMINLLASGEDLFKVV